MAERGLVRWRDDWVPLADLPFLRMGWMRGTDGAFAHPEEARQAAEAARLKAAGYRFRADDCTWIAPTELRPVGGAAVEVRPSLARAARGRRLSRGPRHRLVPAKASRSRSVRPRLGRRPTRLVGTPTGPTRTSFACFGIAPKRRPTVYVARTLLQYNAAATSSEQLVDSGGLSSTHGAYFADGAFDRELTPPRFIGGGVTYWDENDATTRAWGPYWGALGRRPKLRRRHRSVVRHDRHLGRGWRIGRRHGPGAPQLGMRASGARSACPRGCATEPRGTSSGSSRTPKPRAATIPGRSGASLSPS